ncbi:MAG: LptF/LptG family permease [Alphaproteobacteria bacterium]|nr:LptF/LptG family permease [Alphaproteobacteria bacterium]MDE2630855.1 LptF/LptG family permease [Alphaproteobacteria bacterium]
MSDEVPSLPGKTELRAIHLSIAGRHTRYMLAGYLRHVFIMASVLLAIALTIDLWPQFHLIADSHGRGALAAIWGIVRFSALRTPDLVAPFFPFAAFLGVVWTEIVHTQSGERMLVWNSGRSPIQCLTPVILLGIILGVAEFTMDAYLGPAAMAVQMHERLGLDGQRLDRTRRGDNHWIAMPNGLLNTEIEYGPPPVLHNLTFYRRDDSGLLTEVDMATVARRLPGTKLWLMRNGRFWIPDEGPQSAFALESSTREMMIPFAERTVSLDLDPLWLHVFGMETQYLPMPVLRALARTDTGPESKGLYRTRLQVLYGEALLPGAMALLAASLAMLFLAYGTPLTAIFGMVFAGYLAHFGTKACLLMGQNGYMPPVMAGWLMPAALFGATLAVFGVIRRRRGVRH